MTENNNSAPLFAKVTAKCTKCKVLRDHEVTSRDLKTGAIGKVKCLICGSEHKYRPAKTSVVKKAASPKKVDPAKDFNLLSETFKDKRPKQYSMSGIFKAGDVIDHNLFGVGIVISALHQKMEVVFSDAPRILAFNRVEMDTVR